MISPLKPWLGVGLLLTALGLGGCSIAQAQRPTSPSANPTTGPAQTDPSHSGSSSPELAQTSRSAIAPQGPPQKTIALAKSQAQDQQTAIAQQFAEPPLGRPSRPISAANITTVKVFNLDSQCDGFEGESVKLEKDGSLEEAVGLAIAYSNNPDFAISSYRIGEGRFPQEVVVDLRLAPDSKRVFRSLSACESQALFGSIRRTLVENGQFDVIQVEFTAAGEAIVL
jgi:hypothetical protein